jgi:hypothetical protein
VTRPWSLQVAVSELEIVALAMRVATFSLFLLSLLLSLLLTSFRFLLKPGGDDSIGTVRRPTLDLPMQTGQPLSDVQVLTRAFREARNTARSIAPTQGAAQAKRLAAVDGGATPFVRHYAAIALKLVGGVFDIHSRLRYTVVGPRATYVSLAGAEMA